MYYLTIYFFTFLLSNKIFYISTVLLSTFISFSFFSFTFPSFNLIRRPSSFIYFIFFWGGGHERRKFLDNDQLLASKLTGGLIKHRKFSLMTAYPKEQKIKSWLFAQSESVNAACPIVVAIWAFLNGKSARYCPCEYRTCWPLK